MGRLPFSQGKQVQRTGPAPQKQPAQRQIWKQDGRIGPSPQTQAAHGPVHDLVHGLLGHRRQERDDGTQKGLHDHTGQDQAFNRYFAVFPGQPHDDP
ncbi:hypothetical protein D1872_286080 [compost metagenome]